MDLYIVRKQLNMGIPLTKMKLRVTDYSRVSTDHLEQQKSLKNQIEHFDEMIKSNENWTYVSGYVDDGISGTTDYKRDNFMRMIDDARNGKFDLIITKEISRFSRNTLDSIKYTRELLFYGVAVLFVNDNINTALPDSELRLTIMSSMAQDEIRRLSERVKFGMNRSIKNGTILGNNLLYGYKKDKLTGNLIIIEKEANLVKRLYKMYAIDKMSITKIAKIFNEEGIKTCQNKKWCTSTLTRMIKNPKYKGYYCGKKTEVIDYMTKKVIMIPEKDWVIHKDKIRIPPIINENLWDRANERLQSRKKTFGKDYLQNKIMYQNRYALSAKIYCSEDNQIFHRRKQCKSSNDITWTCAKHLKEGVKKCNSPNIRESEIYAIFNDIIKSLEIELSNVSNILLDLYKNNIKNVSVDNKITELKKEKNKILIKKEKLLELNIEGNLSNNEFNHRNNDYNKELSKIEENITLLEVNKKNFNDIKDKNKKLEKILKLKIKSQETKEKLIEILLNKIIVSKINNDKKNIELKIFFNFSDKFIKKSVLQPIIPNTQNFKNFIKKNYEFKRGYNTTSTTRYIVKYEVNSYICM
ncbi:MAG: recombinase family protein [Clostridium sp.]|nr:recombinase family protein [Clostridium sp.]MCM1444189.1 recombinase family protein [Candidatus Amulumruptor caecigallinarius]